MKITGDPTSRFHKDGGQKETLSLDFIQQEPRASQAEVGRGEAGKCEQLVAQHRECHGGTGTDSRLSLPQQ